jgi:hypothetical protein
MPITGPAKPDPKPEGKKKPKRPFPTSATKPVVIKK